MAERRPPFLPSFPDSTAWESSGRLTFSLTYRFPISFLLSLFRFHQHSLILFPPFSQGALRLSSVPWRSAAARFVPSFQLMLTPHLWSFSPLVFCRTLQIGFPGVETRQQWPRAIGFLSATFLPFAMLFVNRTPKPQPPPPPPPPNQPNTIKNPNNLRRRSPLRRVSLPFSVCNFIRPTWFGVPSSSFSSMVLSSLFWAHPNSIRSAVRPFSLKRFSGFFFFRWPCPP